MTISATLFDRAQQVIPGGVNSPVRAFGSVGGDPVYMAKGNGCTMTDADGNDYVDFCSSWGPLILGHAHPKVVQAVVESAGEGLSFGTCSPREVRMAELLTGQISSMDMVRVVNSGTEATMTALRLARGYTGRNKILKFAGCYHGHTDYLLVSAGSGLLTQSISSSAGVTEGAIADMLVCPYNDLDAVEELVTAHGDDLAAVIVEPIGGNMGLVEPVDGFLQGLRDLAAKCGALLILDEVITGFRLGATTYGDLMGIAPDLTCLGKIIGGGMPIGAVGGRKEVMTKLAPLGGVYQAGTLSGNPVALAAGIATLEILIGENPYPALAEKGSLIAKAFNDLAAEKDLAMHCAVKGGMFTLFFTGNRPLTNLDAVKACDTERFAAYHRGMLDRGFYLSPSQFELNFVSSAHGDATIAAFLKAATEVISGL